MDQQKVVFLKKLSNRFSKKKQHEISPALRDCRGADPKPKAGECLKVGSACLPKLVRNAIVGPGESAAFAFGDGRTCVPKEMAGAEPIDDDIL